MKRKVSQIGPSTLMVSLPSKWVKRNSLKKGDELDIELKDKRLVVRTKKARAHKAIKTDFTEFEDMALRALAAIYKKGYDEAEITFDNPDVLSKIQGVIQKEVSFYEIVEQGKNYCKLKSVAETISTEFDSILRRTFIILVNMAESIEESVKQGDYGELKRIGFLEETNNKYTTYCRRSLNKHSLPDEENLVFVYLIVEQLEKIADQYKYLCQALLDIPKGKKLSSVSIKLLEKNVSLLRKFYECFYKYNKQEVLAVSALRKEIVKGALLQIQKSKGKETLMLHHILVTTQQIFSLLGPYLSTHF